MRLEQKLLLSYQAAKRDRSPQKIEQFCEDVRDGFRQKHIKPGDLSIRRLFEAFVEGGRELAQIWRGEEVASYGIRLLEAAGSVNTAMFQFLTGNVIHEHFMDQWNDPEFIGDKLVTPMPTDLREEDIPGVSNFGDVAEAIGELEEYPMVTLSEETVRMPSIQKRGAAVAISEEMVAYDRSGLVLKQTADIARTLRLNKEKRILDVVCGIVNNYVRNGVASNTYLTSGSYVNHKTTNALQDWSDVEAVELLFGNMTDPNTGEVIPVIPKAILVPWALRHTAKHVIRATEVRQTTNTNTQTLSQSTLDDYDVISSQLVKQRTSSDSTWFMGDFKRAFVYREKKPVTVEPMPVGEKAWSRDMVAGWKCSEWGAVGVMEPRQVAKSTA